MNTLTDNQGNTWKFVEFYSTELEQFAYALHPVKPREDTEWKEIEDLNEDSGIFEHGEGMEHWENP